MDLLAELNSLANIARSSESVDNLEDAIERWQRLFNYGRQEAEDHILEQRSDLSSGMILEELWSVLETSEEAHGHDRESYSHHMRQSRHEVRRSEPASAKNATRNKQYLLKLSDSVPTAERLQEIAGLEEIPSTKHAVSTEDDADTSEFCVVDGNTKQKLEEWARKLAHPRPTFIPFSVAAKEFSTYSNAPMLGVDATLPQYRLTSCTAEPRPRQDEYPVWYFFYGTLQDPEKLRALFSGAADEIYDLHSARIRDGRLTEWANTYKALIDSPQKLYGLPMSDMDVVEGKAFLVLTEDHEAALRAFETAMYEVVRCGITFEDGSTIPGCTFRFRGGNGDP